MNISNLCKCCFFQESKEVLEDNKEKENLLEDTNTKVQIVTKDVIFAANEQRKLSLEDKHQKLSSTEVEEDSGTCSDLQEQVQLTVSSVNSILPDLPEEDIKCTEDIKETESGSKEKEETERIIPLVIIAADKQTSQRTIKPNLKKPKPQYTRQCSAPSSSSSSALLPSETSSRRDSFESKKPREKSPCVSFDADVTIVKDHDQAVPMRSRSRSDASNRFRGKMAWLRDRQISKAAIKEDSSGEMESYGKSGAHRPRTRSDSKWLKVNRKKAVERETFFDKLRKISNAGNSASTKAKSDEEEPRLTKSQSLAGLTNHEVDKVKLKRRSSERENPNRKKSVAFDNRSSWWNTSMKYLFEIGSKSGKSHKRRRHLSSDARNSSISH